MSPTALEAGSRTDAGPRPENQDSVLAAELDWGARLVAVADGMGGLGAGARASRTALERLEAAVRAGATLAGGIEEAHGALQTLGGDEAVGSTVVAALVDAERVQVAHVGDSRAWLFGPVGLVPLTRDHTVAAEAAARGDLAAREVADSRWGRALSRSLGRDGPVEVTTGEFPPLEEGAWLVLTSDGVHGVLDVPAIEAVLTAAGTATAAADALVSEALSSGASDNVAAVVIHARRAVPAAQSSRTRASAPAAGAPAGGWSGTRPHTRSTSRRSMAGWDPPALVARSKGRHRRGRRRWAGPGILLSVVVVALVALYFFVLL
jgi:protein phosphatase